MKKLNNKKDDDYISKSRPIISKVTNKHKKLNSSVEINDNNNQNRYSPINTINQSIELSKLTNRDCDNLGNNINDVIDNELKELEEDETKIEFLLEQLNKYRKGNKN